MPFVERNWKGEITGLYANAQPGRAEEELSDDHSDVVLFKDAHPFPSEMLVPLSEEERQRAAVDHERLTKEHDSIRTSIWSFNAAFNELEIALSALLHEALHAPSNGVAYAIYFSPPGFGARKALVDDVVRQITSENPLLGELEPLWTSLRAHFATVVKTRNTIAHGMPVTLSIRGRNHARLAAPVFDQNRVGRHIARTGQPPGLAAHGIVNGARRARWLSGRVDGFNRVFATHYETGNPTLSETLDALRSGLATSPSTQDDAPGTILFAGDFIATTD